MCKKDDEKVTVKEQKNYRIYTFFKEKPELLVGLGSVIAVALSTVLSFFSFVSEKAIVRYWDVDPVYINISTPERLYGTVICFVVICIVFAIFGAIVSIAEKSRPISQIKRYRRRLKRLCRWHAFKKSIKEATREIFPSISAKIKYEFSKSRKGKIELLSKNLRNTFIRRLAQHIVHILFFEALLILVIAVWVYTGFRTGHKTILESISVAVIFSTIMIAMMYFAAYFSVGSYKSERELARNDYVNNQINTDVPDIELPLKVLFDGKYSLDLKMEDQKVKGLFWRAVILVVILLSVMTLTFERLGYSAAEMQDEFWVQNNSGIEYAVVYNNGEIAVLARIEKKEDTAVIDTSKQKIVAVEDLELGTKWRGTAELGPIEDKSG